MRSKVPQLLFVLCTGIAVEARTHEVTPTEGLSQLASSSLFTEAPTVTGRVPYQPGKFSPCWGTTITNSLTWSILTTTFTSLIVVPHITPFADGTNITSYETILPQGPAPTHLLSTTMANGSVCVAPTPCVEQLAQGCGSLRERQIFVGIDPTGSAGSTPFTNPSTYITATSLIETAYTAPPRIEPTADPSSTPLQAPQPVPSPSLTEVPVRVTPPATSSLLGIFAAAGGPTKATSTAFQAGLATGMPNPVPLGSADLPNGFSVLPSRSGVVLPNGQTLGPGLATVVNSIPVSLAPSADFIAISVTIAVPLVPYATQNIVLPNGETLEPGVSTTISGVPVFLDPGATRVIIDGSTLTLAPTATDNVASEIWSGIGAGATSTTLPHDNVLPPLPTGGACPRKVGPWTSLVLLVGIVKGFQSW